MANLQSITENAQKTVVYAIVGATASGKTGAALALAGRVRAEIVCMDSMQVYLGMDIGTAKPTQKERALLPHHMLDVADPRVPFSVTQYAELAHARIADIAARGAVPVLCGGTGLYLRALSMPLTFGGAPASLEIRAKYQAMADSEGNHALHALLCARDPETGARLHENDVRRVVRALEVLDVTGESISRQKPPAEADAPYDLRVFGTDVPRDALYARINARAEQMLADGLPNEVRALLARGVRADAQAMQGLGYKELIPVIMEGAPLAEALATIQMRTRNYAKRQMTWFRADKRVRWMTPENITEAIVHDCQ